DPCFCMPYSRAPPTPRRWSCADAVGREDGKDFVEYPEE
ncbi:hypothetical protein A2U01_0106152, partial [Trifolium medium]|nr:hypothetical protein [Trifolium medium]